jgi:hypothetical protein
LLSFSFTGKPETAREKIKPSGVEKLEEPAVVEVRSVDSRKHTETRQSEKL